MASDQQPSPVVMRRRVEESPQSLEPPLRDSTAHLRLASHIVFMSSIYDWWSLTSKYCNVNSNDIQLWDPWFSFKDTTNIRDCIQEHPEEDGRPTCGSP